MCREYSFQEKNNTVKIEASITNAVCGIEEERLRSQIVMGISFSRGSESSGESGSGVGRRIARAGKGESSFSSLSRKKEIWR
jgi:hypothetical protein